MEGATIPAIVSLWSMLCDFTQELLPSLNVESVPEVH